MRSAIYQGRVWHQRQGAVAHGFAYDVSYLYLDLDELPALIEAEVLSDRRFGLVTYRRSDYLGDPATPLAEAVHEVLRRHGIQQPCRIAMLGFVRTLGYVFNPVVFYYCCDRVSDALVAVVAEINNTPWNERFCYVASQPQPGGGVAAEMDKQFHVSPFFAMDQRYAWRFDRPGERLGVEMINLERGEQVFRVGLQLARQPLNAAGLARHRRHQPLASLGAHAAIYLQAARLLAKRVPFFSHPKSQPEGVR